MKPGEVITNAAIRHPRAVVAVAAAVTLTIGLLAGLPSLGVPIPGLRPVQVDTDPENMLSEDEAVRVFHDRMKERLNLHDMVVVGVVNETHPDGVFNVESLRRIHEVTRYALELTGAAIDEPAGEGVIEGDVMAPSTVDKVQSLEPRPGEAYRGVSLSPLMRQPPQTPEQAAQIRADAMRVPFFRDTLVSADGRALAIYLPISRKDVSYRVYRALQEKIAALDGDDQWHITGLPVAEDTFGVEMFKQMAISAPTAMGIIFVLLLVFFRKLVLIVSPMLLALMSVILTMGLLVIAGFPIHIMSSMIPIFIMPIAVLDSVHIISEFFETYQATRDRKKTLIAVMDELFAPMLYTSLTSAAGFASLALTPIPPVQVFGIFVAIGVMAAWVLTVTFVPAYIMLMSPRTLENFGAVHDASHEAKAQNTVMGRILHALGGATYRFAKPILAVGAVVLAIAAFGITRINVNDNPIKWFTPSHPIRVADDVLNRHFGGTYMAYLALDAAERPYDPPSFAAEARQRADTRVQSIRTQLDNYVAAALAAEGEGNAYFDGLRRRIQPPIDTASDELLSGANAAIDFYNRDADASLTRQQYVNGQPEPLAARIERQKEAVSEAFERLDGLIGETAAQNPATAEAFVAELARRLERASAPGGAGGMDVPPLPGDGDLPPIPGDGDGPAPIGPADLDAPPAPVQGPPEAAAGPREATDRYDRLAAAQVTLWLGDELDRFKVFQQPEVLAWMKRLEEHLGRATGVVGKTNSLVTIAETIHRDMLSGEEKDLRLPRTQKGAAQSFLTFQQGSPHTSDDLWHFTTQDFRTASAWVQLTSGDNQDMAKVVASTDAWLKDNPPPYATVKPEAQWFGLTYINVVWQEKMVFGMLEAFVGSFLVVFLLMTVLFRSPLWGLLSMIPLTVTIAAIYGAIGLLGKDYDMPTAVLSSLTLGLAVDFAIHFLARARAAVAEKGSWKAAAPAVFGEPARAITRNIIVIAVGFTPLLLAPLVPYQTVGILLATILLVSGVGTLFLLPALIRVLEKPLFAAREGRALSCNCGVCLVSSLTLAALVALTLYGRVDFATLTWLSIAAVVAATAACGLLSRRQRCRLAAGGIDPSAPTQPELQETAK